jgi:hypothetical protein
MEKTLLGALIGALQGGTLNGKVGRLGLEHSKAHALAWLGLVLMTEPQWTSFMIRHWSGKACFAATFRRPLLSCLDEVFHAVALTDDNPMAPTSQLLDEVLMFTLLVPLTFTNLRADICGQLACSDASLVGGGTAVATKLRPNLGEQGGDFFAAGYEALPDEHNPASICGNCDSKQFRGQPFVCPMRCGAVMCGWTCALAHREVPGGSCSRLNRRLRSLGVRSHVTGRAFITGIAEVGLELQPPWVPNWNESFDFNTDEGRIMLKGLQKDEDLGGVLWCPPLTLMSKLHGQLTDKPAVRDSKHPMGFPWIRSKDVKAKIRMANRDHMTAWRELQECYKNGKLAMLVQPKRALARTCPLLGRLALTLTHGLLSFVWAVQAEHTRWI